jgi:hypothetical protein
LCWRSYVSAQGFGDTQFFTLISDGNGGWIDQPLVLDVDGGFVPWTETKFAFGEDNKGEIYLCTRYFVYKLIFDATPTVDIGGEEINFHPNPVAPGALIRMNLSEVGNVERLSVFDSSGRLIDVHVSSANGDNASFYTTGLTNGVYSVHIDIVGSEEIVYGKFVVYGE